VSERGHLRRILLTPLSNRAITPNDVATVGNIFGTVVEQLVVPLFLLFLGCSQYTEIFVLLNPKSFRTKLGEQCGCSISVIDFWVRNCLTVPCELEHCHAGEFNRWTKVQALLYAQLHITASIFPHKRLG
jgi:hypothetical protein